MRSGSGASQAASARRPPGPITFAAFSSHLRGAMAAVRAHASSIGVLAAAPPGLRAGGRPRRHHLHPASRAAAWYARPAAGVEVGYSRTDLALGGAGNLLTSRQGAITGAYLQFPLNDMLRDPPRAPLQPQGREHRRHHRGPGRGNIDIELAYIELPRAVPGIVPHRQHPTGPLRRARPGDPDRVRFQLGQRRDPVHLCEDNLTNGPELGLRAGGRRRGGEAPPPGHHRPGGAVYRGTRSILEDVDLKNRAFGLVLAVTF